MVNKKGIIIKLIGGQYTVLDLETKEEIVCTAGGKLRFQKLDKHSSFQPKNNNIYSNKKSTVFIKNSPKVGDYVYFNENNMIEEILERKNKMYRPDICNVDQIVLVFSAKRPDFNYALLDKFLVCVEKEKVEPIIVVTKIDLLTPEELIELKNNLSYYEKINYKVLYISVKEKINLDNFDQIFENKVSVLSGQSGVGKSSIMNYINPNLDLKTNEISDALNRGKHTTRHTELFQFKNGMIADTPGFGYIEFDFNECEELKNYFIDFKELEIECKFRGCNHINEPSCKVISEVENNNILKSRYENYKKFYLEIKDKFK